MVFFTCNSCGTSVKKPKIENHYYQCRFSSVSCIDCNKDFSLDTAKLHNKCFTEDERYSAGGGSLANPGVRKGEAKQSNWTSFINGIFEKTKKTLDTASRNLIQSLLKHENVPRKKAKFMNFVKSSHRNRFEPQTLENVWSIFETEWKTVADAKNAEKKMAKEQKNEPKPVEASEISPEEGGQVEGDASVSKKKKKKKKHRESEGDMLLEESTNGHAEENGVDEATCDTVDLSQIENGEDTDKKTKKKKKKKHKEDYEALEDLEPIENGKEPKESQVPVPEALEEVTPEEEPSQKKKKKKKDKKKKKHSEDDEEMEMLLNQTEDQEEIEAEDASSKKRKKSEEAALEDESDTLPKKKKKKKSKNKE